MKGVAEVDQLAGLNGTVRLHLFVGESKARVD